MTVLELIALRSEAIRLSTYEEQQEQGDRSKIDFYQEVEEVVDGLIEANMRQLLESVTVNEG